jgi:DNA-directed RNA polymerase specialized sigma24 family protein
MTAMSGDEESVTQLLREWDGGSKEALDKIIPLVYEQLHKLAVRCMRDEHPYHTLRATALVHEVYVRLVDSDVAWKDRVHFYSVAAKLLRRCN